MAALTDRDVPFQTREPLPALTLKLNNACPAMRLRSNTLAADLHSPQYGIARLKAECQSGFLVPLFTIAALLSIRMISLAMHKTGTDVYHLIAEITNPHMTLRA